MQWNFIFFFNNILLGIGLAMDAFSVSLANGLNEPCMKGKKLCGIAGIFGLFQGLMPLLGWICIHTVVEYFSFLESLIPWIALALLSFIGIKILLDSIHAEPCQAEKLSFSALLLQGLATSIDALSVGLTIAEYPFVMALTASGIIAVITFGICCAGLLIGKKAGTHLAGKAGLLGGIILILIGLEIFITNWL